MNTPKFSPEELAQMGVRFPVVKVRRERKPRENRAARRMLTQVGGIYGQQNLFILMAL